MIYYANVLGTLVLIVRESYLNFLIFFWCSEFSSYFVFSYSVCISEFPTYLFLYLSLISEFNWYRHFSMFFYNLNLFYVCTSFISKLDFKIIIYFIISKLWCSIFFYNYWFFLTMVSLFNCLLLVSWVVIIFTFLGKQFFLSACWKSFLF